jgi:hypothetical protein
VILLDYSSMTATRLAIVGGLLLLTAGCQNPGELRLRDELAQARNETKACNDQLLTQKARIDELQRQLQVARGINEDDLKRIFFPEKIEIDRLSGGDDYDKKPGDDGVTVYIRPIDQYGDVVKVAGDVLIQIYDLAAPPGSNLVGEYPVSVDQIAGLWHGRLLTGHFTIKCPWTKPPQHSDLTVRVRFVDYLTKRVVEAQSVVKVALPP